MEDVNFAQVKHGQKVLGDFEKIGLSAWAKGVRFQVWGSQNTSKKVCQEDENGKEKSKLF